MKNKKIYRLSCEDIFLVKQQNENVRRKHLWRQMKPFALAKFKEFQEAK